MNKTVKTLLLVLGFVLIAAGAFYSGKVFYYDNGYRNGVLFADSSAYKRGMTDGYRQGYDYCDSIAKDYERMRTSELFNLNIIYEELGDPKKYLIVKGEFAQREIGSALSRTAEKYVKGQIKNTASFARYNEVVISVIFKDKRGATLGNFSQKIPGILYPRKYAQFEVPAKHVPPLTENLDFAIEGALGMD